MESKGQTPALPSKNAPQETEEELKKQNRAHDLQICTTVTASGQRAGQVRTVVLLPRPKPHPSINVAIDSS